MRRPVSLASEVGAGFTQHRTTTQARCVQISAGGKTTSLGDHDTEEEAARAFDRAAINKGSLQAKTNFNVMEYAAELDQLTCAPPPRTEADQSAHAVA